MYIQNLYSETFLFLRNYVYVLLMKFIKRWVRDIALPKGNLKRTMRQNRLLVVTREIILTTQNGGGCGGSLYTVTSQWRPFHARSRLSTHSNSRSCAATVRYYRINASFSSALSSDNALYTSAGKLMFEKSQAKL